jgi:hypothetical protein
VTICLGNPYSPHVEDRLVEEEMGTNRPPVGREGIIRTTEALVDRLNLVGNPEGFKVLLFEHYPTFATLIFDDEIFIYPYAYQILGNRSPIFHLVNDGGQVTKFFMDNAKKILSDAIPAKDLIQRRRLPTYSINSWIGASVYLIPEHSEILYQTGSEILGYDIWQEREQPTVRFEDLRPFVGDAFEFGFHATVADALLFATESAVDRIEAELRVIAKEFSPFYLTDFELIDGLDERRHIVLKFQDKSGTLEALHHEMVKRVYGMAISSYYARGQHQHIFDPDKMRDSLMLERYGAPFILDRFQPHFTLLTAPPKDSSRRNELKQTLQSELDKLQLDKVPIHKIVLVTKKAEDAHWMVREPFQLSKR